MSNFVSVLNDAIENQDTVKFSYTDVYGEKSFRTVVLEDTVSGHGSMNALIVGLDIAKNDYRRFYIDQMENVEIV